MVSYLLEVFPQLKVRKITRCVSEFRLDSYVRGVLDAGGSVRVFDIRSTESSNVCVEDITDDSKTDLDDEERF